MYETIEDIPDIVREGLPEAAQEVYLEYFQESWENYTDDQGGDMDQRSVAHRDAMTGVRKHFVKDNDSRWQPREDVEDVADEEDAIDKGYSAAFTVTEDHEEDDDSILFSNTDDIDSAEEAKTAEDEANKEEEPEESDADVVAG